MAISGTKDDRSIVPRLDCSISFQIVSSLPLNYIQTGIFLFRPLVTNCVNSALLSAMIVDQIVLILKYTSF